MRTFDFPADDVPDRETFDDALTALLRAAVRADVDVVGGYRIEDDEEEFGVEIYRVVSRDD